ncbi:hypothetical protein ACFQ1L_07045 [Phytohabitans flavus]|uniref:hypothetical protein n=1 Tax=Phytohabitans flavus TaxID=1076124 RepID=UPI00364272B2
MLAELDEDVEDDDFSDDELEDEVGEDEVEEDDVSEDVEVGDESADLSDEERESVR